MRDFQNSSHLFFIIDCILSYVHRCSEETICFLDISSLCIAWQYAHDRSNISKCIQRSNARRLGQMALKHANKASTMSTVNNIPYDA